MQKHSGNTIAEYGLIFALILIVSLASLGFLGGSISDLLGRAGTGASNAAGNLFGLLGPAGGGGGQGGTQGGSNSTLAGNNASIGGNGTGANADPLALQAGQSAAGSSTNTTSVEGQIEKGPLGTFQMAETMKVLAEEATDPDVKAYLENMAKSAYYLGGAQGEIDGVPQLAVTQENGQSNYNKADALRDIYKYNQQLTSLMNNAPANISALPEFQQSKALAAETTAIAQTYLKTLDRFISDNGTVDANFGTPVTDERNYATGTGKASSGLDNAGSYQTFSYGGTNESYESVFSYETIQAKADAVLSDNQVESVQVETTLKDAVTIRKRSRRGSSSH